MFKNIFRNKTPNVIFLKNNSKKDKPTVEVTFFDVITFHITKTSSATN